MCKKALSLLVHGSIHIIMPAPAQRWLHGVRRLPVEVVRVLVVLVVLMVLVLPLLLQRPMLPCCLQLFCGY